MTSPVTNIVTRLLHVFFGYVLPVISICFSLYAMRLS